MLHPLQRRFTATVLAAGVALAPLAATAETLADALISAYRHSNLLEQNRAVLRAADEDVAVQLARLRPTVDFVANFGLVDGNGSFFVGGSVGDSADTLAATVSLQAAFTILDGGQRGLSLEAARETVLATREALLNVEQEVLLDAVEAFFNVLVRQEEVRLNEASVRLITQELQAARDRFEVGEVTRTDVAQAESRLALARSDLANARGNLEVAREIYKATVGRYPGALVVPQQVPALPANEVAAKDVAVQTHPLIRQRQREVSVADINADIAGRAYGPTVRMTARHDYSTAFDVDDQQETGLGLEFRQPIYSGGRLPALERQALARRDAARAGLHQTVLGVERAVGTAWARLEIAAARIQATQQQIEASRVAFEGTREEARLGARTTLDVLDAEQELLNANFNRIDALNERYVAIYSLLSAMGLLTVEHLKLGITTYDPAAYYNAVDRAPARFSRQGERLDRVLEGIGR